jgi:hypothetical protein
MPSFLALLPRALTTFLYAVAALLRFYGNTDTASFPQLPFTLLDYSFLAFALGTASLMVNLGLEWNAGNRSRNREIEAREREIKRDDFANEKRERADRERERAARRARIQNRFTVLQIRYHLEPSEQTQAALKDFLAFLEEYVK